MSTTGLAITFGGLAGLFAFLFFFTMRLYANEIKEKKQMYRDIILNEGDELRVQKQVLEALKELRDDIKDSNNIIRLGFEDLRDRLRNKWDFGTQKRVHQDKEGFGKPG